MKQVRAIYSSHICIKNVADSIGFYSILEIPRETFSVKEIPIYE